MPKDHIQKSGFQKIEDDLHFLIKCLEEVLIELDQPELAAALPWIHKSDDQKNITLSTERLDQAYSIAFQLLNMVEENAAAQTRRVRETQSPELTESGLWHSQIAELLRHKTSQTEILDTLPDISVEPVLTAHPTEAKRATVLEQHRALYLLLVQRENQMWTPAEQAAIRQKIKVNLERLLRTGEIRLAKPEIASERQGILYYMREIFPNVIPRIDTRLRQAWKEHGFDPQQLEHPDKLPMIRFGSWVGGDRDGHPFVTDEVTATTLKEHRTTSLLILRRQLVELPRQLSLSELLQPTPRILSDAITRLTEELGSRAQTVIDRNPNEPWRIFSGFIREKLPLKSTQANSETDIELDETPGHYTYSWELLEDLEILRQSLIEVGAKTIAINDVDPIIRTAHVFGFHLAALDVRQNSSFHDKALSQLMVAAGIPDGENFPLWPEEKRLTFLNQELKSTRPFLHAYRYNGENADKVLTCYRILAIHIRRYGPAGIGSFIISMTRTLSDLLVVYLLAREAGLAFYKEHSLVCQIPVVPLFETLEDLENSPGIMDAFLSHPVTQASLHHIREVRKNHKLPIPHKPVQQVMIGYSDSNKDSGILASQWGLFTSQRATTAVGEKHGVNIQYFHGRGGTISRGAGPTFRFLESLPPGTLNGDLRLTEQGETISQKYANFGTATHNLELLLAGTAGITILNRHKDKTDPPFKPTFELLSKYSAEAYRTLLRTENFMDFYGQATPVDALEYSTLGSRPSRRTGQRTLDDLRAIPWVFSWYQARFYLPGWYGVGTALETLQNEHPEKFTELTENIHQWLVVKYVLTNIETSLASADLTLMNTYADLVKDTAIRDRFMTLITEEYHRTEKQLTAIFGETFSARRPRMAITLKMRAQALKVLHLQQIELLKSWRAHKNSGDETREAQLRPKVLLSINAIASGLRTTG